MSRIQHNILGPFDYMFNCYYVFRLVSCLPYMLTVCPYFIIIIIIFLLTISVCSGSLILNQRLAKNGMKHIWECILQQECVPKFLSIILHSNFSRSHYLKKEKK